MIVGKEQLADVLNAQLRELRFVERPEVEVDQVVALQATATSRAVCHIRVIDIEAVGDSWAVRFVRVGAPDRPRFLAQDSSRGYTSDPSRAMPNEPEPVPEDWQRSQTEASEAAAHRRWLKLKPKLENLPVGTRLRLVTRVAEQRRMRVGGEVYKIRRMRDGGRALGLLKKLEERVHKR